MLADDLVRALGGRGGRGRRTRLLLCTGPSLSLSLSAGEDPVLSHCHAAPFSPFRERRAVIEATISPFLLSPARCRSVTPRSRIFAALLAVRHSAEFHICVMHACSLRKRTWSREGIPRPHGSCADLQPLLPSHEDLFISAQCSLWVLQNHCFVFLLKTDRSRSSVQTVELLSISCWRSQETSLVF